MKKRKILLASLITVGMMLLNLTGCGNKETSQPGTPNEIRLDYATYNIESLVIKEKGWLEDEFKKDGTKITFVQSQGSNKSLEFLQSNSIDFGSTAGGAALISKAKDAPIEGIYIYSKPEWAALVTTKDSNIKSPADLKGKKVAATIGTDPYIFLLRALEEAGLTKNDIEFIPLQHSDGANALVTNQIDAWAGLDPYIAKVEVEDGAKLFYRNIDFNTYGFLNVRTEFAEKYPDSVKRVINVYEKAKKWIADNPQETIDILAKEAALKPEIAKKQLERTDFKDSIPGDDQKKSLIEAAKILKKEDIIPEDTDIQKTVDGLVVSSYASEALK
ncbi:aliphatic sulfonate ABC transporter substrate-binding protein [Clostridium sp. BL-8]|uniref:aliphatic sulfonate ABC transporter substrate-binding protein n=1 Tax=Clostridium sp. BL-8 TaxID=349938 RepID=UPI00098CB328|nr:aliphatic sulfonate ABC transporter substrate-binding protein [Clostridium sp. BL-8]OOM79207.1 putative aliphatic sulfonates-binding protein precursor [Clostridium sp. BL-8]